MEASQRPARLTATCSDQRRSPFRRGAMPRFSASRPLGGKHSLLTA
jgi:hypothetical protein